LKEMCEGRLDRKKGRGKGPAEARGPKTPVGYKKEGEQRGICPGTGDDDRIKGTWPGEEEKVSMGREGGVRQTVNPEKEGGHVPA